ncbi:hypothetical protein LIG30_4838, partial [Burkholderia sp. lig30]
MKVQGMNRNLSALPFALISLVAHAQQHAPTPVDAAAAARA